MYIPVLVCIISKLGANVKALTKAKQEEGL
jgi:hypothetical protein